MKTKQLLLELLLINEKYSKQEIAEVKNVISNQEQPILHCLDILGKLTESQMSPRKTTTTPKTKKQTSNIKQALAQLHKEDIEKYQLINQIKETLEDTKQMKLQGIRDYANALNITFSKTIKRPTLIRQIILHLIDIPKEEILRIDPIGNQDESTSALEILSEAIITKK